MDSPNNPYKFELEKLAEILATLESLEVLPKTQSPETRTMDHKEWMARHKQITDLLRIAEQYALLALPSEVYDALKKVKHRKNTLLNLEEWEVAWKRIQEQKGGGTQEG